MRTSGGNELEPRYLELELTESVLMGMRVTNSVLHALADLGISL